MPLHLTAPTTPPDVGEVVDVNAVDIRINLKGDEVVWLFEGVNSAGNIVDSWSEAVSFAAIKSDGPEGLDQAQEFEAVYDMLKPLSYVVAKRRYPAGNVE